MSRHPRVLRPTDDVCQPLSALAKIHVWDRIFEAVSKAYDGDLQMINASSIRVHQHGGNVQKGVHAPPQPRFGNTLEPSAWGVRRGA